MATCSGKRLSPLLFYIRPLRDEALSPIIAVLVLVVISSNCSLLLSFMTATAGASMFCMTEFQVLVCWAVM